MSKIIISWKRSVCPESVFACVAGCWHFLKQTWEYFGAVCTQHSSQGFMCVCVFALTADTLA